MIGMGSAVRTSTSAPLEIPKLNPDQIVLQTLEVLHSRVALNRGICGRIQLNTVHEVFEAVDGLKGDSSIEGFKMFSTALNLPLFYGPKI